VIASLFNFIDRIADGLGVELDSVLKQMEARSPDGEALTEVAAPMLARIQTLYRRSGLAPSLEGRGNR
jgi:hypothetical protein